MDTSKFYVCKKILQFFFEALHFEVNEVRTKKFEPERFILFILFFVNLSRLYNFKGKRALHARLDFSVKADTLTQRAIESYFNSDFRMNL